MLIIFSRNDSFKLARCLFKRMARGIALRKSSMNFLFIPCYKVDFSFLFFLV